MPRGLLSPGSAPILAPAPGRRALSPLGLTALLLVGGCQALSGLSDYEVTGAGGGATTGSSASASASGGGSGEGGAGGATCAPAVEICGNGIDEDCDALDCSATVWARALGGAVFQVPYDVAILPGGEIALAGTYSEGSMTIGGDELPAVPKGRFGVFLAVLDPDGTPLWGFGVADGAGGLPTVATAADGAVFLGARFTGILEVGGQVILTADGGGDPFVARFDADGTGIWATQLTGPGSATVRDLDVRAGEVLVAGSFTTSIGFGPEVALVASGEGGEGGGPSAPDVDGFLATLEADTGVAIAARGVGGPELATAQGVSGAGHIAAGDVAIVAPFVDSITLGEPHSGPAGFAVARLGADGAAAWRRFVQTPDIFASALDVTDVAIGGGRVAVAARVAGTWEHVDPDANATTPFAQTAGDFDLLVAVWSAEGELLWTKQLGDATDQTWLFELVGVAVDDDGAVTLAAGFRGELDPAGQDDPGGDVVSSVEGDWLIAAWDPDGDLRWSREISATGGADGLTSAAVDPASGDLVVAGTTAAPIDVTDPALEPIEGGVPSVVVARFAD